MQDNCARSLHFPESFLKIAWLEGNPAACIDDDVDVEAEAARVQRTEFHTIIEREPELIRYLHGSPRGRIAPNL